MNFQGESIDPSRSNSPTDIKLLEDKGKSRLLTSPSLEDLNQKAEDSWNEPTSPTSSTSSIETIKPSSSKIAHALPTYKSLNPDLQEYEELKDKTIDLSDVNWKNFIKSDIKESIEYIENHLPKSELDDTTYINQLFKDINEAHIKYLQEIKANKVNFKTSEHIFSNKIAREMDNWIENMVKELKKFD